MNPRTGVALMVIGILVAFGGLVWMLTGDFDGDPLAVPATTSVVDPVTTTAVPPTTSTAPAVSATQEAPTTTTSAPPATTSTVPVEAIAGFLDVYRQALDTDDLDFLFARLHPIAKETYGEQLCRDFIDREIAILENYRATADPGEPRQQTISGTQVHLYEVPVEFDFQGQHFETIGTYALVDGRVHYFAECR